MIFRNVYNHHKPAGCEAIQISESFSNHVNSPTFKFNFGQNVMAWKDSCKSRFLVNFMFCWILQFCVWYVLKSILVLLLSMTSFLCQYITQFANDIAPKSEQVEESMTYLPCIY